MKKRNLMITASTLALSLSLLAGGAVLAAPSSGYIGGEKAKQIALKDAGLSADNVTFIRTHLDFDDGRAEYEVEFYQGTTEYDYDIDAVNGTILSSDFDAEYYTPSSVSANLPSGSASSTERASITAEDAKKAALAHAGVAENDTRRMEIDFDYDDGVSVYELEWKVGRTEYSYEVNASTGEVISWEVDYDD